MISTRIANADDFILLATLGRQAFYEAFGAYNNADDMQVYLNNAFNPEIIHEQLKDPDIIYLIATFLDTPVGYAKMKRGSSPKELKNSRCMQLERIYALQEFIGKKIGHALMLKCIEAAQSESCEYLWLGVWQQNERAITFYKNRDFKVIGVKQFIIGKEVNDDFVMALHLKTN